MSDVYHTLSCTVGVRAKRDKWGDITGVSPSGVWVDKPDAIAKDVTLIRLEIEVPESMFGFAPLAKGKIESRLQEEFTALVEELTDAD